MALGVINFLCKNNENKMEIGLTVEACNMLLWWSLASYAFIVKFRSVGDDISRVLYNEKIS